VGASARGVPDPGVTRTREEWWPDYVVCPPLASTSSAHERACGLCLARVGVSTSSLRYLEGGVPALCPSCALSLARSCAQEPEVRWERDRDALGGSL
jgi:hypothetical protein